MASLTTNFKDPRRVQLLGTLSDLIGEVLPLIWSCLWMSDIKCLEELVGRALEYPGGIRHQLNGIALGADFIVKCEL